MQIAFRTLDVDLEVREPAQRRQDRRQSRREHRRIRDDDGVGLEQLLLLLDELRQMLAADLLFTLGDDYYVDGQLLAHGEMRFERLDVEEELSLVVDRSA